MNWIGCGRKQSYKVLSWHLLGEAEESHEKPQVSQSMGFGLPNTKPQ
jgi:hypothetical protein